MIVDPRERRREASSRQAAGVDGGVRRAHRETIGARARRRRRRRRRRVPPPARPRRPPPSPPDAARRRVITHRVRLAVSATRERVEQLGLGVVKLGLRGVAQCHYDTAPFDETGRLPRCITTDGASPTYRADANQTQTNEQTRIPRDNDEDDGDAPGSRPARAGSWTTRSRRRRPGSPHTASRPSRCRPRSSRPTRRARRP